MTRIHDVDILTAYNGALLRVGLYLLIFWPTVGYYVYRDSKKRNLSLPHLRGLIYGFIGVVGLISYILRKR
jgi:hypothetical protein